jgi:hypothetical protein
VNKLRKRMCRIGAPYSVPSPRPSRAITARSRRAPSPAPSRSPRHPVIGSCSSMPFTLLHERVMTRSAPRACAQRWSPRIPVNERRARAPGGRGRPLRERACLPGGQDALCSRLLASPPGGAPAPRRVRRAGNALPEPCDSKEMRR